MKKMEKEKLQRYSIRKLSVGAASVLIGIGFAGYNNSTQVKADTINNEQSAQVQRSSVDSKGTGSEDAFLQDKANPKNNNLDTQKVASTAVDPSTKSGGVRPS